MAAAVLRLRARRLHRASRWPSRPPPDASRRRTRRSTAEGVDSCWREPGRGAPPSPAGGREAPSTISTYAAIPRRASVRSRILSMDGCPMEKLIVEMKQASCYDTIKQYCEYIAKQLNSHQKQSECPHEAMEAVSTLIFPAARYPDLPELCDLTDRYGASIKPLFIQKLQNKSFTNEKLQVMQDIAGEFALPFNTKAIEWNISGVPQNKKDLLKKGSFNGVEVEASGRNGHKVDKHPVFERKSKSIPKDCERKQEVQIKPKEMGRHWTIVEMSHCFSFPSRHLLIAGHFLVSTLTN